MKKITQILVLVLCSIVLFIGCSQPRHSNDVVYVDEENNEDGVQNETNEEITIKVLYDDSWEIKMDHIIRLSFLDILAEQFYAEKGIKVNFVGLDLNSVSEEDYFKELNTMLSEENGPALIFKFLFISNDVRDIFIESGSALNIKGKIDNYENLYDNLKNEYYIPIKMEADFSYIQTDIVRELGCEIPDYNWTKDDYFTIYDKWLEKESIYFDGRVFEDLYNKYDFPIYNEKGEVEFNNSVIKENIANLKKYIYSGKFKIYQDYTYEDYYNSLFDLDSEENSKAQDNKFARMKNQFAIPYYGSLDPFRTNDSLKRFFKDFLDKPNEDYILVPDVFRPFIYNDGFIVNKNGKNYEIGLEFIDFALRDDIQLFLSNYSRTNGISSFAPVVKTVEKEIDKIVESQNIDQRIAKLREAMLSKIRDKDNKDKLFDRRTQKHFELEHELRKLIFEITLADTPYSEEKIDSMLKELENKYIAYFSE